MMWLVLTRHLDSADKYTVILAQINVMTLKTPPRGIIGLPGLREAYQPPMALDVGDAQR